MAVFSLMVEGKDVSQFFTDFKAVNGQISNRKRVMSGAGIEATFVSETALHQFLSLIESTHDWEVESELRLKNGDIGTTWFGKACPP